MNLSPLLSGLLDAAEPGVAPSVARAKELLDLITSPTAVATGVLLTFSRAQLTRNSTNAIDKGMTWWALGAAALSVFIATAIVAVMVPLAWRMTVVNDGPVDTQLLVYGLTFVVAIGTVSYAVYIAWRCIEDLTT